MQNLKLSLGSFLLFSLNAASGMACESFNGVWDCNNHQKINLSLQKTDAVFVLTGDSTSFPLILDGAQHQQDGPPIMTYTGTCTDEVLEIKFSSLGVDTDQKMTLPQPNTLQINATVGLNMIQLSCKKKSQLDR